MAIPVLSARASTTGPIPGMLSLLVGALAIALANVGGWWWVAMPVGLAIGLLPGRGRRRIGLAAVTGALGWGLGLAWLSTQQAVSDMAAVFAGIVGLDTSLGWVIIVVELLLGAVPAAAGAWVGIAVRRLVKPL